MFREIDSNVEPVIGRRLFIKNVVAGLTVLVDGCKTEVSGEIASDITSNKSASTTSIANPEVKLRPEDILSVEQAEQQQVATTIARQPPTSTTSTTTTTTIPPTTTTELPFMLPDTPNGAPIATLYAGTPQAVEQFGNGRRDMTVFDGLKIAATLHLGDNPFSPDPSQRQDGRITYLDNGPALWQGPGLLSLDAPDTYLDEEGIEHYRHSVMFGHRVTSLKDPAALRINGQVEGPFRHLDLMQQDDQLVVESHGQSGASTMQRYQARFLAPLGRSAFQDSVSWIAHPADDVDHVLYPNKFDASHLEAPSVTLFACHEPGSVARRIITRFEQVA